jgi:hypothetical protein
MSAQNKQDKRPTKRVMGMNPETGQRTLDFKNANQFGAN